MITVAAGFPTTVNPIIQNRLVPVFVDVTLPTYEIDVTSLRLPAAKRPGRSSSPTHWEMSSIWMQSWPSSEKYNLWLIEDCCDALGSTWKGRMWATFGDIATM